MIYEYVCFNEECIDFDKRVDIIKTIKEIDREEKCEKCASVMARVLSASGINLGKIGGGYNFHERDMGFGKKEQKALARLPSAQRMIAPKNCFS